MTAFAADTYSIRARVVPALLVVLPVIVAVPCLSLSDHPGWGIGGALVVAAIVGMLGQVGRDAGKSKEAGLFRTWGGNPAVALLRHRDSTVNAVTKARYHVRLARLCPDFSIPNAESEAVSPDFADVHFESCVDFLREGTRDRERFAVVFAENVNYGFRRNLWAMKPGGIALAVAGAGFCALAESDLEALGRAVPLMVDAAMLAFWLVRVTPNWVKSAAVAYAERLLGACESL